MHRQAAVPEAPPPPDPAAVQPPRHTVASAPAGGGRGRHSLNPAPAPEAPAPAAVPETPPPPDRRPSGPAGHRRERPRPDLVARITGRRRPCPGDRRRRHLLAAAPSRPGTARAPSRPEPDVPRLGRRGASACPGRRRLPIRRSTVSPPEPLARRPGTAASSRAAADDRATAVVEPPRPGRWAEWPDLAIDPSRHPERWPRPGTAAELAVFGPEPAPEPPPVDGDGRLGASRWPSSLPVDSRPEPAPEAAAPGPRRPGNSAAGRRRLGRGRAAAADCGGGGRSGRPIHDRSCPSAAG